MLRPTLACMLTLVLLSGCTTQRPEAPRGGADAPAGGGRPATGAPSPSASSAPASPNPTNATATPAAPRTTRFDGSRSADVYASPSGDVASVDPPYGFHLDGNRTGVVVEMAWTPTTPAASAMGFDVQRLGEATSVGVGHTQPATLQGTVAGAGPLRLALPDLPKGDYIVRARASGPNDTAGAAAAQKYTLWVTVFDGVPFDAAYTAPK